MTLRATAAPDIEETDDGWTLKADGGAPIPAMVMLDAVLPEPDLSRITEPLMVGLLSAGILAPRGEGYMAVSFSTGM